MRLPFVADATTGFTPHALLDFVGLAAAEFEPSFVHRWNHLRALSQPLTLVAELFNTPAEERLDMPLAFAYTTVFEHREDHW